MWPGVGPWAVMDDVTTTVVVEGGCSGRNRQTRLRLAWRRTDPLAVSLLVTAEPDHPALPRGRWSMLRDYLRDGLSHPAGVGDVRVRPDRVRDRIVFELWSDGRACVVAVAADTVRSFLDATEEILPAGSERSSEAIDAELNRLNAPPVPGE